MRSESCIEMDAEGKPADELGKKAANRTLRVDHAHFFGIKSPGDDIRAADLS